MQLIPSNILDIPEITRIHKVSADIMEELNQEISDTHDNIFITDATEDGIARREKILNLLPLDTDTLDDRRFRVLINWYDTYPYTVNDLKKRLNIMMGVGQYELTISNVNKTVKCLVELTSKKMKDSALALLEKIIPLNMTLSVTLRYNQWLDYSAITWGEMATKTWLEAREEVL